MMKTRTGMLLVALAGLLALLLLPACGEEKVLTLQYWQAATLPSSYLASGYKDTDAAALTLEPLANYDPSGNLTLEASRRHPHGRERRRGGGPHVHHLVAA